MTTKLDILARLQGASLEEELRWMLALGTALTVSARGYYPVGEQPGNLRPLIGFNELQHQVYGRIRQRQRGAEWTLESFMDVLLQKAQHYQISVDLGWALKSADSSIR